MIIVRSALQRLGVNPNNVEITLPTKEWFELRFEMERITGVIFDEQMNGEDCFRCFGFTFRQKFEPFPI